MMTDTEQQIRTLENILKMFGPHPKASTNTPEHWQGVVNAMKDIARKALKK